MAEKDQDKQANQAQNTGEQLPPEQKTQDGGEPVAAKEGESVIAVADRADQQGLERTVNELDPAEEQLRQQAEAFPRAQAVQTFDTHEETERVRAGQASTSRSDHGRVVTVHEDTEEGGEVYKAGTQDIGQDAADALIAAGKAFEPAGKKRGR